MITTDTKVLLLGLAIAQIITNGLVLLIHYNII